MSIPTIGMIDLGDEDEATLQVEKAPSSGENV